MHEKVYLSVSWGKVFWQKNSYMKENTFSMFIPVLNPQTQWFSHVFCITWETHMASLSTEWFCGFWGLIPWTVQWVSFLVVMFTSHMLYQLRSSSLKSNQTKHHLIVGSPLVFSSLSFCCWCTLRSVHT